MINGNAIEVENLIDGGADVNVQDRDGYTPLIWAAFFGHVEILENLMVNAATINKKSGIYVPMCLVDSSFNSRVILDLFLFCKLIKMRTTMTIVAF